MNWERFITVERAIDDRFLEEAQAPITNRSVLYRTLAFAACFCLVLGGVAIANGNLRRKAEAPRKMMAAGSMALAYNGEAEEAKEAPAVAFAMAVPESAMEVSDRGADETPAMEEEAAEPSCMMDNTMNPITDVTSEEPTAEGFCTLPVEVAEPYYLMANAGNPITDVTPEELIAEGFYMLPENVGELLSCCLIAGYNSPIAEIRFLQDGIEYTLRQILCDSAMDISGIFDEYSEQELVLNGNSATLKIGTELARVEQYLDSMQLQFCLSTGSDNTDILISLAREVFPGTKN